MTEGSPTPTSGGSIRAEDLFRKWFIDYTPVREKLGKTPPTTESAVAALFPALMEDGKFAVFEDQEDARIPAGWSIHRLSRIVSIHQGTGLSIPKSPAGTAGVPLVTLSDMPGSGLVLHSTRRLSPKQIEDSKVRVVRRGATLLSNESQNLRCGIVGAPLAFNRSLISCEGKEGFSDYFIHFLLRACHPVMMRWCFMSGCRYRLDQSHFDQLSVVIPPLELACEFEKIVTPWMEEEFCSADIFLGEK